MKKLTNKAILGTIIFSSSLDNIHLEKHALLVIGPNGKISDLIKKNEDRYQNEVRKYR